MKNYFLVLAGLGIGFAAFLAPDFLGEAPPEAVRVPAQTKFDVGYNEAWFGDDFLFSFVKTFDAAYVDKIFRDIKAAGGDVVRVYLFQARQGILVNKYAPQTIGIDPKMVANIKTTLELARANNVKLYLTLHDANAMPKPGETNEPHQNLPELRDFYYNLIHNKYGEGDAFNNNVLAPLLGLLSQHQDAVYAIDIANEYDAAIKNSYWGWFDNIEGPQKWLRSNRDFIRAKAPWVRVSASAMHPEHIVSGLFTGVGLDFYDVHIYDDNGTINYVSKICDIVRKTGIPIIIGEFGQQTKKVDDALQVKVARNLLNNARAQCFSGALAWRFDSAEAVYRYQLPDGSLRPAARVIQEFKAGIR